MSASALTAKTKAKVRPPEQPILRRAKDRARPKKTQETMKLVTTTHYAYAMVVPPIGQDTPSTVR